MGSPISEGAEVDAANSAWRIAFAFDLKRQAILLCGSKKSSRSQRRFYRRLIAQADQRHGEYLDSLRREREQN